MKIVYALLADYAAPDSAGKQTLVGVFDAVHDVLGQTPIPLPPCYLAAVIQANAAEGSVHQVQIRLRKDSGDMPDVFEPFGGPLHLGSSGPGYPLRGMINIHIPGLAVPERGDYFFEIVVNGKSMTRVPLRVMAPPGSPVGPPTS